MTEVDSLFALIGRDILISDPEFFTQLAGKTWAHVADAIEARYGLRPPEALRTRDDVEQVRKLIAVVNSRLPAEPLPAVEAPV
jgi:hypothetical protein